MSRSLPAHPACLQAGAVHRRQLAQAGVSDKVIRRWLAVGQLRAVGGDVFVVASAPATRGQEIWVELLRAAPGSVVALRTAAQVHRVGRLTAVDIDVLEAEVVHHRAGPALVHRSTRIPASHRTVVDGMPVTTLERTLFDLCGIVSPRRRRRGLPWVSAIAAERALDDALARGLNPDRLRRILGDLGGRGRPGTVLFRDLLAERLDDPAVTESALEDLLLDVLAKAMLPRPERQVAVGDGDAPIGRVDFLYRLERVVIEVDGRAHHTALLDAQRDRERDRKLQIAGFAIVRVTYAELVDNPGRFTADLAALLASRQPRPFPR